MPWLGSRQPVGLAIRGDAWQPLQNQRERLAATAESLRAWWHRGERLVILDPNEEPGAGQRVDTLNKEEHLERVAKDEQVDTCKDQKAARGPPPRPPSGVLLETDFATLKLSWGNNGQPSELSIKAKDGTTVTDEGIQALLQLMDQFINLPEFSSRYELKCDLQSLSWPQLELISGVRHWGCDIERRKMLKNCRVWIIILPVDLILYDVFAATLGLFFFNNPPMCRTEVVIDPVEVGTEHAWRFDTDPWWKNWDYTMLTVQGDDQCGPSDVPDQPAVALADTTAEAEEHQTPAVSAVRGQQALPADGPRLPASLDVGFIYVTQHFNKESGNGELRLFGRHGSHSVEGLDQVLDFMDQFAKICENAGKNFAITYDLRTVSVPPLSMVKHIAAWGNEPERQARWTKLNNACKVVVHSGFTFSLAKGILTTYFYACPPVCRTFLLTDPNEPEKDAYFFDPADAYQVPSPEALETKEVASSAEAFTHQPWQPRTMCASQVVDASGAGSLNPAGAVGGEDGTRSLEVAGERHLSFQDGQTEFVEPDEHYYGVLPETSLDNRVQHRLNPLNPDPPMSTKLLPTVK